MIYKCLTNWDDTAYNMLSEDNLNEIETLARKKKEKNFQPKKRYCQTQKCFFKLTTVRDVKLVVTFATEVCF